MSQGRRETGGGHYGPPPWGQFVPIRKRCGLNCVPSNSHAEVLTPTPQNVTVDKREAKCNTTIVLTRGGDEGTGTQRGMSIWTHSGKADICKPRKEGKTDPTDTLISDF